MGRSVATPWVVLAGIGALWGIGLLVLGALGLSPARGRQVNRALDALAAGRREPAAEALDRVAAAHPGDTGAWLRAGRALVAAGRPIEGAERLEHAATRNPASATARYEWAKALLASGFDDEAEVVLQQLLELKPDHGDGLFLAAAVAASRADAALAAARFEAALAARCTNPDRWRFEPRFDRVRNDPGFLRVARDARYAAASTAVRP